jgi:hypothetical protein
LFTFSSRRIEFAIKIYSKEREFTFLWISITFDFINAVFKGNEEINDQRLDFCFHERKVETKTKGLTRDEWEEIRSYLEHIRRAAHSLSTYFNTKQTCLLFGALVKLVGDSNSDRTRMNPEA